MTEGIILKGIGGFYYVDTPEGLIECKARGRFRKTVGKPIVGDRVTLEIQPEDGTGYLLDIAPRKNSLGLARSGPKSIMAPMPTNKSSGIASEDAIPTL